MNRRSFVKRLALGSLALGQLNLIQACKAPSTQWKFKRSGIPMSVAHSLRSRSTLPTPSAVVEHDCIIIGAGISGLSVGYHLAKTGATNFLVLEMEEQIGGNAQFGETNTGKFPQGAHYLPVQNLENQPLLDFLHAIGSISHFSHDGIPYYNEANLCHEPEERLFINGKWHEGIVEALLQVYPNEKPIWDRFFRRMQYFQAYKGADGKDVFYIPERFASLSHDLVHLDQLSFQAYLTENDFRCTSLDWYLNYCCRDDYGQNTANISAFAGIHYFAARKAKSKNCSNDAMLTWPEGNAFLANQLASAFPTQIQCTTLVLRVQKSGDKRYELLAYNWKKKTYTAYITRRLVICTPRHVRARLLADTDNRNWLVPTHQPWWVATVELKPFSDFSGAFLSWDNVIFAHQTLGYIHNLNQQIAQPNGNTLLTFYKPLDSTSASEIRKAYEHQTDSELEAEIVSELKSIYPEIEKYICYLEVRLWGHGMVSPGINYVTNPMRKEQQKSVDGALYFAHTDDAGFSLFEEAFDLGYQLANQLLNTNGYVDSL